MKKFKYILFIIIFFFGGSTTMLVMAENKEEEEVLVDGFETQGKKDETTHGLGKRATPIDMYEGILMIIAFLLVIGYYYNERNKRITNS